MKKLLFLLLLLSAAVSLPTPTSLFAAIDVNPPPPPVTPPHTEGGSCCRTGFTYTPNTCLSDQVPGFCSSVAAGVIGTVFGTPIAACRALPYTLVITGACNLFLEWTTGLASTLTSACIKYFIVGGTLQANFLCLQFFEPIEEKIDDFSSVFSYFGIDLNDIINDFQATCSEYVSDIILDNFPADLVASHPPQCNLPLSCDLNTGTCQAASYIAASSPYCDYLTPASGIRTAIGCLPLAPSPLIITLLNWAIGISGSIGLILVLIASFQIATSRGVPERLAAGRDLLFSAIAGIILIALGVVLLNFIGVNVLGLQNLGFRL